MLLHESGSGQSTVEHKHSPDAIYHIQKEITLVGRSPFKQVHFPTGLYSLLDRWSLELSIVREYTEFSVPTRKNYSCPSRLIENICSSFLQRVQWAISDCAKLSLWSLGWSPACKPWGFLWGVKLLWKHLGIILFKNSQSCQETESEFQDPCWEKERQDRQKTRVLQHQRHTAHCHCAFP